MHPDCNLPELRGNSMIPAYIPYSAIAQQVGLWDWVYDLGRKFRLVFLVRICTAIGRSLTLYSSSPAPVMDQPRVAGWGVVRAERGCP